MVATRVITVVGCHAEGEQGDVITGGVLPPPGDTMMIKKLAFERDHDDPEPPVEPAGDERDHRAPPEPPHGTGEELLLGTAAHGGFRLGEERRLDEIEVVEQTDPGHTREEVDPPQQEQEA